ncbi:hypothetical protein REPUB_Repub19eG0027200 [Reevesia pubescens]
MEYQRASAAMAFTKKLSNGHSFNGNKNMYDGVFGGGGVGQSKLVGARVEDYAEVFGGGSSGSSIPVLDVPELNERKFSVDVSSSKLDYSNIFGGFGDFDFAVSHEEVIAKPTRDKKTPTKTRSYSEGSFSYPSSNPVGNQVSSNDQTSHVSDNGMKQFKMSYNKSSPGSKNGKNGTTHVAQLHAVPGYTCVIDEKITPSKDKPVPSAVSETYQTNNFGEGIMGGMHCKIPVSNVLPNGVSKQASKGVDELHSESRSNGSDFNDVLFGSYNVGLAAPPSKVTRASSMSYNMGGNKRDSLKFGVSRSYSLDGDAGVSSPPYFDDEVDANSVAATSAAAVKKAIEEAQARLKVAKEMMERRKEGHIGRVKPSVSGSSKAEERKKGKDDFKQNNIRQDKAQETCEKIDASVQTSAGVRNQNVMKVGQVAAESEDREKSFIAREAAGGTCAKNFISSQADRRQEEVEKREAAKEGESEKDVIQALNEYEGEKKKIIEKPEKYGEKPEVVEEATEQEYERKLDASEELRDMEECLHKLKPDVQFHDRKEDETKLRFSEQREETQDKVCIELEACERKLKDPEKPTEDERKVEMQELEDIDNLERLTVAPEWVDMKEKHKHKLRQEEYGSASRDVFEKEEVEMLLQDVSIQKELEKIYEEAFEISELKGEDKEACGPEENNEEEEEDACNREDNEQMSDKMEKPEVIDFRHNDFDYEEERERRFEENDDSLGNEEFMEAEENGDLFKDAYQMEEIGSASRDVFEKEEMLLQDVSIQKELKKIYEEAFEISELKGEDKEACGPEENNEEEDACNREDNEQMSDKMEKPEIIDLRHNGFDYEEERERRQNDDSLGNEEFMEAEENGDLFEDAYQMEAVEEGQKEAPERMGTEEMQKQTDQKADETTEAREDALGCCQEDFELANDAYNDNEVKSLGETLEPSINEDSGEMTPELLVKEENGGIAEESKAYSECKETRRDSEAVEVANDLEESMAFDKADLAESNLKLNEIEQQKKNTTEAFDFDRHGINIDTADVTFEQNQYEQQSKESELISTMEKHVEKLACEFEDIREAEFGLKQEENKCNFEFSDEGRLVDSQLHCKFGNKHETTQIAHEIETSQSIEYNEESHHETPMKEERETKNSSQEEVKVVKEQQRRVDEAKEREREREKERIAVERAIREARERAFAEARERAAAGRTNVEARRKVKSEAQGESTKPSAEANDKSIMEAKLKAERAAVERATAEARQRALEKALSEKASFGGRKQAEKSSDAKQSFQSYDSRYKGSCPPATSRYPNSSNQCASKSSEGLDGATGESAQRCKARLERHQRTTERAVCLLLSLFLLPAPKPLLRM